jgi:hypothetical protein
MPLAIRRSISAAVYPKPARIGGASDPMHTSFQLLGPAAHDAYV